MNWKDKAMTLLDRSLHPIPQELNEIDWKGGLSDDKERLAQHICAFSNLAGGGVLVFGISNDATLAEMTQESIERIVTRLDNIAQNRMYMPIQLVHDVMDYQGHTLLFVYIPECREKPMHLRGTDIYDCYIRSAGHTVKMSRQQVLQLGLCERRGSGVDRAVEAIEAMLLPAYKAESGNDFTRVTIYPKKSVLEMTKEERIEACYQHCCLMYADNDTMNNQSVRERFGLNKNQGTIASHIISDTVAKGLIKSSNPDSESRKFVSYIPFYA